MSGVFVVGLFLFVCLFLLGCFFCVFFLGGVLGVGGGFNKTQ